MSFWKAAKVVKSNPDDAQRPVRLQALRDDKILYMPVPELAKDFPFLRLDPVRLSNAGISYEVAATIEGALEHGERVQFDQMLPMDVLVVGCVAVASNGGRTGKGAGFADLEMGIFREVGTIPPHAQVVTTVHDFQVVEPEVLPLQPHDSPLDWIITPTRSIETKSTHPRPRGVHWDAVRPEQFRDIPFLKRLKDQLTS
jgi:5-formyltetrahydrofolate cyclo-ligase